MLTVGPRRYFGMLLGAFLSLMLATVDSIAADEPQDHQDRISRFNVVTGAPVGRSAWPYAVRPPAATPRQHDRLSVGSVLSINQGLGPGEDVDLTYDDAQYTIGQGRHIAHWWNGLLGGDIQVNVHFGYSDQQGNPPVFSPPLSGYNAYDAVVPGGDWPLGQNVGFELQARDILGWGGMPSLDIMGNGLVVMGATSAFSRNRLDDTRLVDNLIFYQDWEFGGFYDPLVPLNVTWIDSITYRPRFLDQSRGIYSRDPQVVTQMDAGGNTVVHLLLGEDSPGTTLTGPDYCDVIPYYTYIYFRKVGDDYTGSWSAGQIIDSLWFPWMSMAAEPNGAQVAVTYTNPTYFACLLENPSDLDVWLRESEDYGLTWGASQNITNYDNHIEGGTRHFTAWLETQAFYSTDGDLHVIWTAKPTSGNPYFDGFDWESLDQNLYHWSDLGNEISKVANGAFPYIYSETGISSIAEGACGFGGSNAGYIANINISECDGKLYCIWNQIHERANRYPWRDVFQQPAAGALDDCAYTDEPMARANWEIMMSVALMPTSSLWDIPRNLTKTYTPNCGLSGDEFATGLCGSEYKPSVERYGLDETGMELYWPAAAIVDPTPEGYPPYYHSYFLNLQYLDDQFPGPSMWGEWQTQPRTWNEIKWIRLACVDPIEAAEIAVAPTEIRWPIWVDLGQSKDFAITVVNEGNVLLHVIEIGTDDNGGGWLSVSENPTPENPFLVTAGVIDTATFDIIINAAGITQPAWLDGLVWLKSDAVNVDSLAIPIHILAADTVEPVVWDTVKTHPNMLHPFLSPVGACVALAVGNNGELGWGARSDGRANLDYTDASKIEVSRRECDTTRAENRSYLISSTPFAIVADASDGSGAVLSQVYRDWDQFDQTGFDPTPAKGSIRGGVWDIYSYDSVYTGQFVNRDTSIAMERVVYAPRSTTPATDIINFVVVRTKVYSADGQPHNHVTVGNVTDWNVPSDRARNNTAGILSRLVYVQGTDAAGYGGCASNQGRFATEAYLFGYTSDEPNYNPCANTMPVYSQNIRGQSIMVDTTNMRDGTPLDPPQPNPLLWWQTAAVGGLNVDPVPDTGMDLCVFTTYKHDYNLPATEILNFWTVMTTTPIGGTLEELTNQVNYARMWIGMTVIGMPAVCCQCRVGDVNGQGEYPDEITLGDIMLLVDVKFISGDCTKLTCLTEADVNQDGGANPSCEEHVTLGDIMTLVDFLFITGPDVAVLPACL